MKSKSHSLFPFTGIGSGEIMFTAKKKPTMWIQKTPTPKWGTHDSKGKRRPIKPEPQYWAGHLPLYDFDGTKGFNPLPKTIDLKLTREDAKRLYLLLPLWVNIAAFNTKENQAFRQRILNKLKRAGIR